MRSFNDKNRNRSLSGLLSILFVFSLVLTVYAGNDQDLINAIRNGNVVKVKVLLAEGVYANAKNNDGITLLMEAAVEGNPKIVNLLLDHGADVNAKTKNYGGTALMWAALHGNSEVINVLIAHGADVNTKTSTGKTALIYAAEKGHPEIVQLLKKAGAKE